MPKTAKAEKPILFSSAMIRAILEGRKTQTRRVVTPQPPFHGNRCRLSANQNDSRGWIKLDFWSTESRTAGLTNYPMRCPYGKPGDRLWVRETWAQLDLDYAVVDGSLAGDFADCPVAYKADHYDPAGDGPANPMTWRPSIHMPRRASRITLEVIDVKVERIQSITAKDILAEGAVLRSHNVDAYSLVGANTKCPVSAFDECVYPDLKSLWATGWDSINGNRKDKAGNRLPYAWADNPWVWAISYRTTEGTP